MRLTCFITVCAYLSSTVSTDEIKPLNRIRKIRLREELMLKDAIAKKEINPITEIYPDVQVTLQKSRPRARIEMFQRFKRAREPQFVPQQHRYYNRGRSRRPQKRLKIRSIAGAPYELNDNQLNELTKTIPEAKNEGSIHIEPIVRVTTKTTIFDSIVNILHQLLGPPKNELGPLVGPIKTPGSGRKIYIRLIEPVKSSHIMVRFVTQVPVPVVDAESVLKKRVPAKQITSIVDPVATLVNTHSDQSHQDGHFSDLSTDAVFDSSNHHSTRNTSHLSAKDRRPLSNKPSVLNPSKKPLKDLHTQGSFSPGKPEASSALKINNSPTQVLNLKDEENSNEHLVNEFLSESSSYPHQYQSEETATYQVQESVNDTTASDNDGLQEASEPSYQLSTHRLPLKQVAPSYQTTSVKHTDTDSYANTYKTLSNVALTPPDPYPSSYEQYNSDSNSTSGFYASSYDPNYGAQSSSYSTSHDQQNYVVDATPSTSYSTIYHKQNGEPSSYATSHQDQNELNNAPSFYPTSYERPKDIHSASNSYEKPKDIHSSPNSYSNSYEKPNNVQPPSGFYTTSREKQNGVKDQAPSSKEALRIIEPPSFSGYAETSENDHTFNRSSEVWQPRYNPHNFNRIVPNNGRTGVFLIDQLMWDKTQREKSESYPQKDGVSAETDGNDERWQPIVYVEENANRHDPIKIANIKRETKQSHDLSTTKTSRKAASSIERDTIDRHRNGKRRVPVAVTPSSGCSISDDEEAAGCELAREIPLPERAPIVVYAKRPTKVFEKRMQSVVKPDIEPIVVVTARPAASITARTLTIDTTTRNPSSTSSTVSSATKRTLPLMEMAESNRAVSGTTEASPRLIETSAMDGTTERLIVNETISRSRQTAKSMMTKSTTEKSTRGSTTTEEASVPNNTAKKLTLPKRPMVMKKPRFIMKKMELSTTTRKTIASSSALQKPTTSTTTKRPTTTRKSSFRGTISRSKTSTT